MKYDEFLEKLGLSTHESAVYLSLLQCGTMSISEIARRTKLYRTMVYDALGTLLLEGLVTISPKGKYKVYSAESPRKLESKFVDLANNFDNTVGELEMLHKKPHGLRPNVQYVEGRKGISGIHDDIVETLKKGDTYYRYSSSNAHRTNGYDSRAGYLSKKYRLLRDQKKLERKVITNVHNKAGKRPRLEREIKVIPPDFDLFEYNISQIIYGDKVAIIDYTTETAVTIEHPTIAQFQQKIFELLFRKL